MIAVLSAVESMLCSRARACSMLRAGVGSTRQQYVLYPYRTCGWCGNVAQWKRRAAGLYALCLLVLFNLRATRSPTGTVQVLARYNVPHQSTTKYCMVLLLIWRLPGCLDTVRTEYQYGVWVQYLYRTCTCIYRYLYRYRVLRVYLNIEYTGIPVHLAIPVQYSTITRTLYTNTE